MADSPSKSHLTWSSVDIWGALILLLAQLTAADQLYATGWTNHLEMVITLAFWGTLAGLLLGYSAFGAGIVFVFALLFGLFGIHWQLGLTLLGDHAWLDRMYSVYDDLATVVNELIAQEPVTKSMLFLALMAALFWALSVHAGYVLARSRQPWTATLPTFLTMLVILINGRYVNLSSWFLAFYIFFMLLLAARSFYHSHYQRWKSTVTYLPELLGYDLTRAALVVALVLVVVSWNAPALAESLPPAARIWEKASQPLESVRAQLENFFSPLQNTVLVVYGYYDESLSLGTGQPLSMDPKMTINVPPPPTSGMRYYWRARSYDTFNGLNWSSGSSDSTFVSPQAWPLEFSNNQQGWEAVIQVTSHEKASTLYIPGQPQWVSQGVRMELITYPDDSVDYYAMHAEPQLDEEESYVVRTELNDVTIAELRAAGDQYPAWVRERYLQLPTSMTARTQALAEEIARGAETPYDIAANLTQYLRDNIQYNERMPELPVDQDIVDWFLFDWQQGFCNYYATAEVILLRAAGVPARWAVGYAQGERVTGQGAGLTYLVRERDGHSWPEVYFPNIGWVEFEPTVSQEAIERPLGIVEPDEFDLEPNINPDRDLPIMDDELELFPPTSDIPVPTPVLPQTEPSNTGSLPGSGWQIPWLWVFLPAIGLLLLGLWRQARRSGLPPAPVLVESGLRRLSLPVPRLLQRWSYWAALPRPERDFQVVNRALRSLGHPAEPTETPAERVGRLSAILPEAGHLAQVLLGEYQTSVYSDQEADWVVSSPAARRLRRMVRQAWWQHWLRRLHLQSSNRKD
ncbi:MAG: transglutaminase domain-containing protein [Anaerolineales bacterium]|nr:transglutaminase domain-containing protein [Anaerolineales bacterium]